MSINLKSWVINIKSWSINPKFHPINSNNFSIKMNREENDSSAPLSTPTGSLKTFRNLLFSSCNGKSYLLYIYHSSTRLNFNML